MMDYVKICGGYIRPINRVLNTINSCGLADFLLLLEQSSQTHRKYASNEVVDIPNDI